MNRTQDVKLNKCNHKHTSSLW